MKALLRLWLLIAGLSTTICVVRAQEPLPLRINNAGFEEGQLGERPAQWSWWHREKIGSATLVEDAHSGRFAVRIVAAGEEDWAFSGSPRNEVEPGRDYAIRVWYKGEKPGSMSVQAVGHRDGEFVTWSIGGSRPPRASAEWAEAIGYFTVPQDINQTIIRVIGRGDTDIIIDDISVVPEKAPYIPPKPKVEGFAKERVDEKFARCAIAQMVDGAMYISWRLLAEDAADCAFDVFRTVAGKRTKLNATPIRQTCDWLDEAPVAGASYAVALSGSAAAPSPVQILPHDASSGLNCQVFKLSDPEATAYKVGIGDLDGDGIYDYVVMHPGSAVDPWHVYWKKSAKSFKLDAFLSDGTLLWTYDRGWSIEQGIWYAPFIVGDLTGDGRAEVALKAAGDVDLRDEEGKVTTGDEWLIILDGMSGEEIARAPWPSRDDFENYNLASRNQIVIAYLDGKTPCVVPLRGTYSRMTAEAWQLKDGKLEALWRYDNHELPRSYRGQGAHTAHAVDIDGDGRDEIILGSVVLDDTGDPLWTTGKGHPDGIYYGDIIPQRPGKEIAYIIETGQRVDGGICVVDALSGEFIWKLPEPTKHVHGSGVCADLDPRYPGVEVGGSDADGHKLTDKRWLFTADGQTLLKKGPEMSYGFGVHTAYWDGDLQEEIVRAKILKHDGGELGSRIAGRFILAADVLGDWREEILTGARGEFRIYSTDIPAMDRRVCLMQDMSYRMRVGSNSMGYTSNVLLSQLPSAHSPNLNLTVQREVNFHTLRVVVTAPMQEGLVGAVHFEPMDGVALPKEPLAVNLAAAGCLVEHIPLQFQHSVRSKIKARLILDDGRVLRGQSFLHINDGSVLKDAFFAEAEDFVAQSGGEVRIRSDKAGVQGKAFSHWDEQGHSLSWTLKLPEAGRYQLVVRYSNNNGAQRSIRINEQELGDFYFFGTGGFGDLESDWDHFYCVRNGQPLILELPAGEQRITMVNKDGKGNNLDYLALIKK
jgi:rhamnogalacturonan endolyase